jgi:hypothetical protein
MRTRARPEAALRDAFATAANPVTVRLLDAVCVDGHGL